MIFIFGRICQIVTIDCNRFVDISSNKIQVGDIIEVHMTFIAVPVKDGKKKVVSTLRLVILLDGNLTEVSCFPPVDFQADI